MPALGEEMEAGTLREGWCTDQSNEDRLFDHNEAKLPVNAYMNTYI